MSGGIIGTETFNVGNPGNREVKGSLNNKGKVIKGKKSNKIIVTAGQLRQTGTSIKAKYGMTLDDYVDKAKEENPNIKLTMTPGQWLINPTENNEVINNDKKFNLMVQSSNVNVDLKGLHDVQSVYDNTISNFKKSIGNPDEENLDYWINSLFVPEAAKLKKQYPNDDLTFDKALKLTYDRYKYSQNNKGLHEGKDIATTHNNPGNIKYGEFAVKYGATPGKKAADGGVFAVFPSIEAGEEARRGLLRYGKNYRNLTVDEALKRWSNNGYNGSIVPNLAGLKIKDLTDDQFNQLSAAQIRSESNAMFKKLNKNVQLINNSLDELKRQSGGITKFQVAGDTKKKDITEIFKPENGTILPVQNNIPQVLLPEQEIKAEEPYWKEKQRQLEEGYLPYKGNKFLEKFIPKRYKSSKNQYEERKQDYIDEEMARTVLKENPYDRNTNANKYMYNLSQAERDILLKSQTWDKTARTYPDKLAQGLFSTFRGFTPNVASNKLGISPYDFNVNTYTRNEGKETGIGTALEGGFGYLAKPLQGVTNAVGITNFNKADNSNYTVKDALQGKQNDAGIIADALTDVTNYTGYGLGKKLIPNLTKRGKNVLNFLKESNYIQALNPNYYKRHVKDAATLMDEETLLKETGQNILNSKQTAIGNLKKINIKGDDLYLQEGDIYKNLRSTPQYQKIEDLLYKTFYPPKNFPHPKNRLSPIAQQTINKKNSFQNINFSVDAKGRLVNTVSPSSFSNTGSIVTTPIEGGKNIINLRTGKQVPVTINPPKAEGVEEYIYDINSVAKKSNVPLKKTLSRQINSGDNYDINSEYIETLKDNISFIKEKFPNSKPYGSAVTVSEVGLPHLTNDVDVIMTKADYEKIKNSYPISHDIKYGAAHIVDESLGDVGKIDVNVLQEDKNGLATGNLAAEIYRQFFPDEFYAQNEKLIQKAINENKRLADVEIKILKTPDELLKSFDPETKSVIDAYEAGMEFGKEKHINRIDVLINYGDTDKVAKGQLQYAKSIMGSNADIGKQFDTSVFLDTNKNKEILNRIEFIGDKDKIAKDPKRMQLALNDYYINNSIYTRQVTLNPDYHKNIDNVIDSYMTWKGVGGTGSGAGLNTVKLGDSGLVHGQITGSKQFKLYNDEVKSLDDYVSLIERQTQGNYKFNSEEQDMIRDIAKKHNVSLNNIDFSKDLLFNWDQNGVTKYQSFLKNVGEQLKLKTIQEGYYGNSKYATDLGHFDSRVDKLKLSLQSYFPRLKSFEQRKQHFSNSNLGLDKKSVDLLKNEYHQLVNVLSTDYLKLMDERKINKTIVDNLNKRKQELLSKLKVDIEDKALNSLRENKKIVSSERDKLQKELSDIELEIYENDLDLDRLNWKIEELEDRKREISNIRKTYAGILVGGVALNEGRKQLNLDSTNYDADYNDDKKFIEGQLNQMNKWSPKDKERFNVNYDVWNKDSLEKSLQIKHSSDLWNLKDDNLNYVQKRKLKEAKHSIDKLMYRLTPDNYEKSLKNKEKRYFKTNTKPIETKVGHQFGGQIKYKQYQSGSGNSDNALGDNTIPYTFYSESNILPAVEIKGKRRVGSSTVSLTPSDQPTNSEFKKKDNVKENLKWLAMLAADTAADQIPYSENVKAAYDVYKGHPVTGAVNYLKIPATPVVDALINMGQNNPTGIDTEHLDEWLLKNFNKNVFTKNLKTQSRPGLGYAKGGQIKYKQYVTK